MGPLTFTADGGTEGEIQLEDTCGLFVKQEIILQSTTQQRVDLEIKRVLSKTQIKVGRRGHKINDFVDVSLFRVVEGATIRADEQTRRRIPPEDIEQARWSREPINADRTILVDPYGDHYKVDNPIPVRLSDGQVNIGTVNAELEVQLSHRDNYPDAGDVADSVQIGDGEDILRVNPDGSISTADSGLDHRLDVENNIIYEGVAEPGTADSVAGWRISRTVKTSQGDLVTTLAGTGKFDQVWDDRLSLFPAVSEVPFFERRFERLLPLLTNANWMKLGNFDQVTPSFTDEAITMSYFEAGVKIGQAEVKYVNDLDWEIKLERYINDADGDMLLDDDDEPLFLD